jgi:hypothetical protein
MGSVVCRRFRRASGQRQVGMLLGARGKQARPQESPAVVAQFLEHGARLPHIGAIRPVLGHPTDQVHQVRTGWSGATNARASGVTVDGSQSTSIIR